MMDSRPGPDRTDPTDDELEDIMRAGLAHRAEQVDTEVPILTNHPRARRWILPVAAAAAIGVIIAGALVVRDNNAPVPPSDGRTLVANPPPPSDWRLESWHGVQVSVPPDWGWGGAPSPPEEFGESAGSDNLYDCGLMAYRSADGKRAEDPKLPYVGRPIMMTDACSLIQNQKFPRPSAPYVWLGASIDPGTVDLGAGWQQTTVEVAGTTVTVATQDASLRERILGTAHANPGTDCEPEVSNLPAIGDAAADVPSSMSVCAYRRGDEESTFPLRYATTVDAQATRQFLAAVDSAPRFECPDTYAYELVVLRVHGEDGTTQTINVDTGACEGISTTDTRSAELNVETVSPWAVDGIPAYVIGPHDAYLTPGLSEYFRGILG